MGALLPAESSLLIWITAATPGGGSTTDEVPLLMQITGVAAGDMSGGSTTTSSTGRGGRGTRSTGAAGVTPATGGAQPVVGAVDGGGCGDGGGEGGCGDGGGGGGGGRTGACAHNVDPIVATDDAAAPAAPADAIVADGVGDGDVTRRSAKAASEPAARLVA